jgi:hypothetical protein
MKIGIIAFMVAAMLVGGGILAWRWLNRTQNLVSHAQLTRLEAGLLNDTCEICHRRETELYRGNVKAHLARPAWKGPVTCTDCHDFALRRTVNEMCVECHTARYEAFLTEWKTRFDEEAALIGKRLKQIESGVASLPREGFLVRRAERLMKEAREALDLVKQGRGAHHPEAAEALLVLARHRAKELLETVARQ